MKKTLTVDEYFEGVRRNDRTILSKAITLIESSRKEHQEIAQQLIDKCLPYANDSIRLGITGVPGVGKSTFIEAFGSHLTGIGKKIAVLAVDPTSQKSGGSILGDKTRMNKLSVDPNAFVRPSPSGKSLGGVAKTTREAMILFAAASYDVIIIETVGVGQSETTVHTMVDCFILLMLAGAGDELQGIKRGIMEMTDLMFINKADGDNATNAKRAAREYQNALHLFPLSESKWSTKVFTCSAMENLGIDDAWQQILAFKAHCEANGYWSARRQQQALHWMKETIENRLFDSFYSSELYNSKKNEINNAVTSGTTSPYQAAKKLLDAYFKD